VVDLYFVEGGFPGRLAVVGRPRGGPWLADDMAAFAASGITLLVSALGDREVREGQLEHEDTAALEAGIAFRRMAIPNLLVPTRDEVLPAFEDLASLVAGGANLAVHCWSGVGRSPLIVSSVLVLLGLSAEDAWQRVERARGRNVPDTGLQRQWVHLLEEAVREPRAPRAVAVSNSEP
jgi:protein-tyrosine phosphatase